MTDTNKLAELIKKAKTKMWGKTFHSELERNMFVADFLLANGVIIIPCKVGTEVFLSDYIDTHHRVKEYKFLGNKIAVILECWEWQRTCTRMLDEFGKTVFLTKEEAEEKLRECNNGK